MPDLVVEVILQYTDIVGVVAVLLWSSWVASNLREVCQLTNAGDKILDELWP